MTRSLAAAVLVAALAAAWIIGTVVTVGAVLAGFMYALVGGVNSTVSTGLASVNKRIDDVRVDLQRLHDDHDRLEERLRGGRRVSRISAVPLTAGRRIGPAFPGVSGGIASAAAAAFARESARIARCFIPASAGPSLIVDVRFHQLACVAHQAEDLGSRREPRPEREHLHPPRSFAR